MDNNRILCLNSIIFQIYNVENFDEMRGAILSSIGNLIPISCGSILMVDHTSSRKLLCNPVCFPERFLPVEQNYLKIEQFDYSRWLMLKKQAAVVKATSLMPDEDREKTALYQKCYAPYGLHYSVDLTIVNNGEHLGILTLYRSKAEGDFTDDDVFLLQMLSDHLNARFHADRKARNPFAEVKNMNDYIASYALTGREAEILYSILYGKSNEDIAEELCISPHTLKKHLQNIYRKTGTSSRIQLFTLRP